MHKNIQYINNELCIEDIPLEKIIHEFGTPCYVYSSDVISHKLAEYQSYLNDYDSLIAYAVKANSNIAILNLLSRLNSGFDVVSIGELQRVIMAGGNPKKVVFSGVGKQKHELKFALEKDIYCFNIESESELLELQNIAKSVNKIAPISFRINPNIDAKTHPYISTGLRDNKFGIEFNKVICIYETAQKLSHINIKGIDCHIGSQILETKPIIDATEVLIELTSSLKKKCIDISHINIGGGFGICYKDEAALDIKLLFAQIKQKLRPYSLKLIIEPGRSIVGQAGILLSKVEYIKNHTHKNFAITDTSMNDLLRPTLYNAWHDILPVTTHNDVKSSIYDIVGSICESSDFLGLNRKLSIKEKDHLAILSAGAYGFSMSSNYNSRNKAAEILVHKNKTYLIRARETIEYQTKLEEIIKL